MNNVYDDEEITKRGARQIGIFINPKLYQEFKDKVKNKGLSIRYVIEEAMKEWIQKN